MPIRLPVSAVESRHHIFVPYYTGKPGPGDPPGAPPRELLIFYTGQLVFSFPAAGFAGEHISEEVWSFVPDKDGKIQNFARFMNSKVAVTASIGAIRSTGDDDDHFFASVENIDVKKFVQNDLTGDPTALILKASVHVKRGNVYRVPYQVTVRVCDLDEEARPRQLDITLLDAMETGAQGMWSDPGEELPELPPPPP
ncbi:hypothetical protein [Streptomyces tricolor]|uniref:Uncharacterized protein n=1 Tax=Streptomyces tricolor TaxID=68277 RepID=A0ABS9JIF6_9ACTN|nr:hypothetical protein [Streptomyces tricolor]MCG0065318.1 hypothetical protein [Streptomyces tricolor]